MTQPSPARIMDLANAFQGSALLLATVETGLFAHVAAHPGSHLEPIARTLSLDIRATHMVLDACCALGLLIKQGEGYHPSPESAAFLAPGQPGDLSGALAYNRTVYPHWGNLSAFLRSGRPVQTPGNHLGGSREATRGFVMAMHARAQAMAPAILAHIDLSPHHRMLDLACGPGVFSVLAAARNPELHCTLFDLPRILDVTKSLISNSPAIDRLTLHPGDFHVQPFPGDMDLVTIFGALHQESADAIRKILRGTFAAMVPGGRILVLDMMTDASRTQPAFSTLFSITMGLTTSNGWAFSDTDLASWMCEAGFVDYSCKPLPPPLPHWLATARKP